MKQKLLELAEILKQKPEIKERLESYTWHLECYELLMWYHDVLEYLGEEYYLSFDCISHIDDQDYYDEIIKLSLWPLSDQTDETLDEIISLCKNVWKS